MQKLKAHWQTVHNANQLLAAPGKEGKTVEHISANKNVNITEHCLNKLPRKQNLQ